MGDIERKIYKFFNNIDGRTLFALTSSVVIVGTCKSAGDMLGFNGAYFCTGIIFGLTLFGIEDVLRERRWKRNGLTELEKRVYRGR